MQGGFAQSTDVAAEGAPKVVRGRLAKLSRRYPAARLSVEPDTFDGWLLRAWYDDQLVDEVYVIPH